MNTKHRYYFVTCVSYRGLPNGFRGAHDARAARFGFEVTMDTTTGRTSCAFRKIVKRLGRRYEYKKKINNNNADKKP